VNVRILTEAQEELTAAVAYHEELGSGSGVRLKKEARRVLTWIQANPEVPRLRPKGYRRVNLRTFPYYVACLIWEDSVWVLAIAHGHRSPEFWMNRKEAIGGAGAGSREPPYRRVPGSC
jgi:plasmid stabilization system protein ParE